MLRTKDIIDEKDKRMRLISEEVKFPLSDQDKEKINEMIKYLHDSQIEELADKMKFYLQNPHQWEELALKGREHIIDSYSEDKILNQWYQLFEELDKE